MATTTTNYGLRKPATTDFITVGTDISDNMDILDTIIKALRDDTTQLVKAGKRTGDTAAITTTETQYVSSGSINLLASSVYLVEMNTTFFTSVTNDDFVLRIHDTSTAGTLRYQTVTYKGGAATPYNQYASFIYRTTTAETGRSFIGSAQRNTGTGNIVVQGGTYLAVSYIGPTGLVTDI